jgi:SAM-dependent methyltransferase
MRAMSVRPCVVCGAVERSRELTLGDYDILRCGCGLRVLAPEPASESLVEVFDDGSIYGGAFDLEAALLERSHRSLIGAERFVKPGRILDVGFGPGFLLRAARERGWTPVGVDPSRFSVERARRQGFEAHQGLLDDLHLPEASFDAVSLMQVVEHILDPRDLLAECRRVLRPGGALLVATPNPASLLASIKREGFNYWIPPVHCVWYAPDALHRLLVDAGLEPVRLGTWSARAPQLHDGVDMLAATRLGRRVPRRARRPLGTLVAMAADALGRGSIVEAVALRWEASE